MQKERKRRESKGKKEETKFRKQKEKSEITPRFDKKEIIKIKKDKKEENIDKLKKKVEKSQNKKFRKERRKEKIKPEEKYGEISRRKRMKIWILVVVLISILFIVRIGWIQFVMGDELKQMAFEQQSIDRVVNPRRGTIYDATGKTILAVSSTVNTITVNPNNISKEDKEKVAEALSNIFELDYETVLKK